MTQKTITICDFCNKELKLGLLGVYGIFSVNLDMGSITFPTLHFCSREHMRDYLIDKCEIMENGNVIP